MGRTKNMLRILCLVLIMASCAWGTTARVIFDNGGIVIDAETEAANLELIVNGVSVYKDTAPPYIPPTPAGVVDLTSNVTARMQQLDAGQAKIYRAVHSLRNISFQLSTRDWVTNCDMIVMYAGSNDRLPTIFDYNAIMADIAATGQAFVFGGKTFSGNVFYYGIAGQNEGVQLEAAPVGIYYVFIYNASDTTGWFDVGFAGIP